VGAHGEPVWPKDVVGSISHAEGYCGVVVARRNQIASLGLDVEVKGKLGSDCWELICTRRELARIASLPLDAAQKNADLVFSAKECLYKCQHSISKRWLDFQDVMITINSDIGEFIATFLVSVGDFFRRGTSVRGRYFFAQGYVFTGMSIPSAKS
jgi:4'-phosphopantetheinyl transferase EntD